MGNTHMRKWMWRLMDIRDTLFNERMVKHEGSSAQPGSKLPFLAKKRGSFGSLETSKYIPDVRNLVLVPLSEYYSFSNLV